eukprot:gene14129-19075_t
MVTDAFLTAAPFFGFLSVVLIGIAIYTGASIDRTNRRLVERERRARIDATHDSLTGLANRVQFQERLAQSFPADDAPSLSILYIDLDGFKGVNDRLGHLIGDELLKVVAKRLVAACGDAGTAALIVAGLMVGLGTRYGAGCTSGHGVCGLSRLSPRSLAATATFMAAGFATVFIVRHLA